MYSERTYKLKQLDSFVPEILREIGKFLGTIREKTSRENYIPTLESLLIELAVLCKSTDWTLEQLRHVIHTYKEAYPKGLGSSASNEHSDKKTFRSLQLDNSLTPHDKK